MHLSRLYESFELSSDYHNFVDQLSGLLQPTDLITVSDKRLTKDSLIDATDRLDSFFKPTGLWFSHGVEWIDWIASEEPHWMGQYIYVMEYDPSVVLIINNTNELEMFNDIYSVDNSGYRIDWPRISDDYCGIDIIKHFNSHRFKLPWYSSWDCASGCIWDPVAITKFDLIFDMEKEFRQYHSPKKRVWRPFEPGGLL